MPFEEITPGLIIGGRYRIVERLGQGGMAEVYKAYQESLERYVAIKFIRSSLAKEPDFQRRFQQEARYVAALRHPNIVQIHDFDQDGDMAYMVMEFIDGPTLKERLAELAGRGQWLSLDRALELVRRLGHTLSYAHQRGMIHRDVKPANIMFDSDGRVVLGDFGLARMLAGNQLSPPDSATGTPDYMAPEQIMGQPADGRADIYSLAVVLYELVARRLPFKAETLTAVLHKHLVEPPPPPSEFQAGVPVGLEQLILKAMAKKPEERHQSVDEFLAALGQATGAVAPPPNNLPAAQTSFVGREEEVAAVCNLLRRVDVRLVTLTGPGGAGKTRLSLQVAAELLRGYPDGVFLVPLAPLQDPDLVVPTIAQAVDVKESGSQPLVDALKEYLRKRRLLLVLDNFEQVLDAGPQVNSLLAAAPHLRLLVTSRELLSVYGECEYPVPPLAQDPAIALFVARARAASYTFDLTSENAAAVAEICARLDGLPLAIELAAARVRSLAPQAILERLSSRLALLTGGPRDLPARQQTLRGAIDWSYDLLNEAEKAVFARSAVFVGGFTPEAAEAILDSIQNPKLALSEVEGSKIQNLLASLVDKNLLRQGAGGNGRARFSMLETIREYALERLEAGADCQQAWQRHAAYYLSLVEAAEPHLRSTGQIEWLDRLAEEYGNLRNALQWFRAAPDGVESGLRLAGALWGFWELRGQLSEGRQQLAAFLEKELSSAPAAVHCKALNAAGYLAYFQSDFAAARAALEQSLAISRPANDQRAIAYALLGLGAVMLSQGDEKAAQSMYEEALALAEESEDRWCMAGLLSNLGAIYLERQEQAVAQSFFERSLEIAREVDDKWVLAFPTINLGELAHLQGQYERAAAFYQESLALYGTVGNTWGVAYSLARLATMAGFLGDYEQMKTSLAESLALFQEMGNSEGMSSCLIGLAGLAAFTGQPQRAARLLGAVDAFRQAIGTPLAVNDLSNYSHFLAMAQNQLDAALFATAWAEGQATTLEQAAALAMNNLG
ncbi:MAG: protein kinase [Chloroflexi bacterium]|nr:protein kinase [Chloroflexota bacterium]MCI0576634.1 protein kinase [Chloroflexota bacterium]MCI0646998.1 protein kinase [Chloroflexota bacterium]MCI0730698.1 protein kinase [Chloroflexota bacterium]